MTDHLIGGGHALQNFRDILTQLTQLAATIRTRVLCRKMHVHLTRQMIGQRTSLRLGLRRSGRRGCCCEPLSLASFQFFELQL